jgi:hypothetical protein
MSQADHERIRLPDGWWLRFVDLYQELGFTTLEDFCADTGHPKGSEPSLAPRTLYRAKNSTDKAGQITAKVFDILLVKLDLKTRTELLGLLEAKAQSNPRQGQQPGTLPKSSVRIKPTTPRTAVFPRRILATRHGMPQWADHWEIPLDGGLLGSVTCAIETSSPYFRFGFKLLTNEGEVFGDSVIKSQEAANMLIHIGRNNFARPEISTEDIFLTIYRNGIAANRDQKLFTSNSRLQATVSLSVEGGSAVSFSVNGNCCCRGAVPPAACRRVVMLGWGDREEYEIRVTEIQVTTLR